MTDDARENRQATLHAAENLIASAVALLYPLCGEHVTRGLLEQMVHEQARFASFSRLYHEQPPSEAHH